MVGKTYFESMLDESGFGASTEMVEFALECPRSVPVMITFLAGHF